MLVELTWRDSRSAVLEDARDDNVEELVAHSADVVCVCVVVVEVDSDQEKADVDAGQLSDDWKNCPP